jgi:hypothetical protein
MRRVGLSDEGSTNHPQPEPALVRAAHPSRRQILLLIAGVVLAACTREKRLSQPEPGFLRHRADDVIAAWSTAGLPLGEIQPRPIATATPDPVLRRAPRVSGGPPTEPMVEVEARTFVLPGLGDKGGQIFIFDSAERLRAKQIWFLRYPDLYPHLYVHDNVLVKMDAAVPDVDAERYRAALETLVWP